MNVVRSRNLLGFVEPLLTVIGVFSKSYGNRDRNSCVTLIQFYSLLENVFRNVLLRPYLPAYRTINLNCGRYRCFIKTYEDKLPFNKFHFEFDGQNLLTYTGTDQEKTILYALTCSILCHYMIEKLENSDKDSKRPQQQ